MDRREAVRAIALVGSGLVVGACSDGPAREEPLVGPFADTAGHQYAAAIERIRLAGLTAGCGGEPPTYCPDRPLTRGEAAVMLARLLDRFE
jgi:hypothetical protein